MSVLSGPQPGGYQGNVNIARVCTDKGLCASDTFPPVNSAPNYWIGGVLPRKYVDLQCIKGQDCSDVGLKSGGRAYSGVLWS